MVPTRQAPPQRFGLRLMTCGYLDCQVLILRKMLHSVWGLMVVVSFREHRSMGHGEQWARMGCMGE
jgi:hypothetical protein